MFDNLSQRLSLVVKRLRGEARLTDDNIQDALREVRLALLEADVALPVVKDLIAAVKEKAVGEEVIGSLTPGQALIGVVHRELAALMGGAATALDFAVQPPAVILLAGLQGAGKTTTAAKLAHLLRGQKKKVLLVSADVYRPAAIEQLAVLGAQVGADVFPSASGEAPVAIAAAALDWAKRHYHDVLIVDTAGRLAIDEAMMREITALHAAVKPVETLFVVDAMQGQDAVNTARAFRDALPLTGVILTKLDGDARGGAALSVRHVTGAPIKFAGVSEKIDGLEPFHPERMASRILGMGDVLSLIEGAQKTIDVEEANKFARKMKSGKSFDLDDYKAQIGQMRKMGGLTAMLDKLPAELARAAQGTNVDDRKIGRVEGIINSMTPAERTKPELLKASRKRRIATGAGVSVQEVNQLLNQFEQAQKMMKMMAKGGMQKMLRGMKGFMPRTR
ncbi:MAG: signal recognition particle protein [Casimicrobiaceae bacterium]